MFVPILSFRERWTMPWQGAVLVRMFWHLRLIEVLAVRCHFGGAIVPDEIGRRGRRTVGVSFGRDEDRRGLLRNWRICGVSGGSAGRREGGATMLKLWCCHVFLWYFVGASAIFDGCKEVVVVSVMKKRHHWADLLGLRIYGCRSCRKPFFP